MCSAHAHHTVVAYNSRPQSLPLEMTNIMHPFVHVHHCAKCICCLCCILCSNGRHNAPVWLIESMIHCALWGCVMVDIVLVWLTDSIHNIVRALHVHTVLLVALHVAQ